jgi:hypothetical protein
METIWLATWESGGNMHVMAHRREILLKRDLLNWWGEHHKAVGLGDDCPAWDCTWEEFSDFAGVNLQQVELGTELGL